MDPGPGSSDSQAIGVVTGLASEAAVVTAMLGEKDTAIRVVCAGASTQRAAVLSRELVDAGVHGLLSFGIAGALDPSLDCGDLVVADNVVVDEIGNPDFCPCDETWLAALHKALDQAQLPYRRGDLVGSSKLWRDAKDKEAIFEITGSPAVDMESGSVGRIAAEAGLPFLAVRAVADRAGDSLPALVGTSVKPNGKPAVGKALAALIRRPGDLRATLRLARQSELALARLRMLEAVKGALFGGF